MIVAADRKQARVTMRYCKGLLASVPMLAQLIQRDRDGVSNISLDLSNRITLEVHTASYRTTRGFVAALLDEFAFWPTDDSCCAHLAPRVPHSLPLLTDPPVSPRSSRFSSASFAFSSAASRLSAP